MSRAITSALVTGALLLPALADRATARNEGAEHPLRLSYCQPGIEWTAALPIGSHSP